MTVRLRLQISAQSALARHDDASLCSVWHADGERATSADVSVTLPALLVGAGEGLAERWVSAEPCLGGRHGAARYRHNAALMFVAIDVEADATDIADVTRRSYDALFATMHAEGYLHLVRCWNYVPHINADQLDPASGEYVERYRLFNLARQDAFRAAQQAFEHGAPAACALGSHAGGFTLYALAAKRAPICIENPRQISAYHYPPQYGPKSPSFSRASLLEDAVGGCTLFVSGTASIVGHQSLHIGDLAAQTEESLRNIAAVVEQANAQRGTTAFDMRHFHYKTFVRHAADAEGVAAIMRARLGADVSMGFLLADVCRAELLVEIEAVGFLEAGAAQT